MNDAERHDPEATPADPTEITGEADGPRRRQRRVVAAVAAVVVVGVTAFGLGLARNRGSDTGVVAQPGTSTGLTTTVAGTAPSTSTSSTARATTTSSQDTTTRPSTGATPVPPTTLVSTTATAAPTTTVSTPSAAGTVLARVEMNARDVNGHGEILGLVDHGGLHGAVVWSRATGQLTPLDVEVSDVAAINDKGWIAGVLGGNPAGVFRWSPDEGTVRITPEGVFGEATDMNEDGHVVGHVGNRAFLWTPEHGLVELPMPEGATAAAARGMNDHDEVVGYADFGTTGQHAFFWSAARGVVDLGTLGGRLSVAADVDNQGMVVGNAQAVDDGPMRIFTWTAAGGMVDLGTLGQSSIAVAVNDRGTIIGNWFDGSDPNFRRGFIFTPATGLRDITATPRERSALATSLNESDQVLIADEQAILWEPTAG